MPVPPSYLSSEIASVKRDITVATYGTGVTLLQTDEIFLGRANAQYKAYEDLRRDSHCQAVLSKREMAVIAQEWDVEAGGTSRADKKAAEMVKAHLAAIGSRVDSDEIGVSGWDFTCLNLLDAILKGFSVGEVIWGKDGNEIFPSQIKARNQQRFSFALDEKGRYELRLITSDNVDGERLTKKYPRKFITHCFGAKDGNPYGLGLGSTLWFPVFFKKQDIKFWLTFVEKFASPTAIGKHSKSGATAEQKRTLLEALEAIATDVGIVLPEGVEISLLEAARSGSIDCYEKLATYMDTEISKTVLGETLSTQMGSTGSYAAAETHNGVRKELSKADADLLSDTLNRTICRWITELNIPGAKPPRIWRNFKELEDLNARVQRDKVLFDMGWSLTAKAVAEIYGDYYEQPAPEDSQDQFLANSGASQEEAAPEEPATDEPVEEETTDMVEFGAIIDRVVKWQNLSLGVEYLPGQVRISGRKNSKKLRSGYGHIRSHVDAKGEALDCYLFPGLLSNPQTGSDRLFQVRQVSPEDGDFDEYKFMLGYPDLKSAREAYLAEMPVEYFGGIQEVLVANLEQYRKPSPSFAEEDEDAVDVLARRLADESAPLVSNWVEQVRAVVGSAKSFEDVRDRLVDLYPQINSGDFAEVLGQAMIISEAAGRYEVIQETDATD